MGSREGGGDGVVVHNNPINHIDPLGLAEVLPTPGGQIAVNYSPTGKHAEFQSKTQFHPKHPFEQAARTAAKKRIEEGQSHEATYDQEDPADSGAAVLLGDATPEQVKQAEQTYIKQQSIALAALSGPVVVGAVVYATEKLLLGPTLASLPGGQSIPSSVPRTGPRGIDPNHHNANVTIRDAEGKIILHTRVVSGSMTAEEKALGFPLGMLASHTEARGVKLVALQPGQKMTITGQLPPCPSCRGTMNKTAVETGATIVYQWRQNGVTHIWRAGE